MSNSVDGDRMFAEAALRDLVVENRASALEDVEKLQAADFQKESVEALLNRILARRGLQPVTVSRDPSTITYRMDAVDIGGHQRDCVRFTMKYKGSRSLLVSKPSAQAPSSPRARVERDQLTLTILADENADRTKAALDEDLDLIEKWLGWGNADATRFNKELQDVVQAALEARKAKLEKQAADAKKWGFRPA